MKSQHEKEVLLFKGEFKSKGGSIMNDGTAASWTSSTKKSEYDSNSAGNGNTNGK